ncbi:MAG: class I SAM-dependent methyltransferase [Chloroflexota bacterium]
MTRTVREAFFGDEDIYGGFPAHERPPDLSTWGGQDPIFSILVDAIRPVRILEIGSRRGASAISMAACCRACGVPCEEIICIDTWLGNETHMIQGNAPNAERSPRAELLERKHGRPTIYESFLANVIHFGFQDLITPLPVPSDLGLRILARTGFSADLIYMDAAHDYESVAADLAGAWPLLVPGGLLLAHDYTPYWHGVMRAIDEFSDAHGLSACSHGDWRLLMKDPALPGR